MDFRAVQALGKSEQLLISLRNRTACHAEGRGFEPRDFAKAIWRDFTHRRV